MSKSAKISYKTSLFLKNLSNLVDGFPENVGNILKTSYMAQCDILERTTTTSKCPEDYLTVTCPKCNIDISETAKFDLIPKQCSKFTRTLRKRIENGSSLTNYQKRYAKDMPIISHDKQVAFNITCNICKNSIKKVMSKWKTATNKRKLTEEPKITQIQPKKKKKKVDKFCGLNTEAIQSVQNRKQTNKKMPAKLKQTERQTPLIVSNINKKKKRVKNNIANELMKNKNKLSQILGVSLASNSGKSIGLNNFFNSF